MDAAGPRQGTGGPAASSAPRRLPRLSLEQLARLPDLWPRGADAYGCRGQVWTRGRIAAVMHLACGI
jgi:hypothetical protein